MAPGVGNSDAGSFELCLAEMCASRCIFGRCSHEMFLDQQDDASALDTIYVRMDCELHYTLAHLAHREKLALMLFMYWMSGDGVEATASVRSTC